MLLNNITTEQIKLKVNPINEFGSFVQLTFIKLDSKIKKIRKKSRVRVKVKQAKKSIFEKYSTTETK